MSTSFRGSSNHSDLNNEPYEAAVENPPQLKFAIGISEVAFGIFANCVQLATTTIAILSMIIVTSEPQTTFLRRPDDLLASFGWKAMVSLTIAGAIQLFLHKNAQPMSSTWHRLRQIQHFNVKSTHAWGDVFSLLSLGMVFFILALVGEIISDATFVNLFTRNPYVIVGWMLFLTGSSTLLLYDGATRIWGAIEDWKDYRAYHRKHDQGSSSK